MYNNNYWLIKELESLDIDTNSINVDILSENIERIISAITSDKRIELKRNIGRIFVDLDDDEIIEQITSTIIHNKQELIELLQDI